MVDARKLERMAGLGGFSVGAIAGRTLISVKGLSSVRTGTKGVLIKGGDLSILKGAIAKGR